jgi:hypothetical protein
MINQPYAIPQNLSHYQPVVLRIVDPYVPIHLTPITSMQYRRQSAPVTQDSFVLHRLFPIVRRAYLVSGFQGPTQHLEHRRHHRCTDYSSY